MLYGISQLLPVFHPFQQKVLTLLLLRWHSSIYLELSSPQQTTGQLLLVYTTSPLPRLYSLSRTLASQYHFRILHRSSFCGTQKCPLFVWACSSPRKSSKKDYPQRSVIYKYQRRGQLTNSNKYGNKYYSPYSAHTASRNIRSLWCWCLSSLHFTPILTPQPKASSILMNLILS